VSSRAEAGACRGPARLGPPAALALAVLVVAVFAGVLRNGFVWDDRQYILDNARVAGGLSAGAVRWALTATDAGNWHPLTWLSHLLDVTFFGLDPRGPHLVNVLLHLGNTLALATLLLRLTGARRPSLLVAALFAVHPLHVESVAWIAERKDVLSTLFGLLAALAYCRFANRPGVARYAAVALLLAASLAAKQMLVTLPCALLLLDWWPLGRLRAGGWRRAIAEKIPLLAVCAIFSFLALQAQAGARSEYPLPARFSNAAVSYLGYLGNTVAPADLAAFYPHPVQALPAGKTAAAALALAAVTAAAVAARRRVPWLATGWLWFLGTLVPVIGIVQVGEQALADRYTYIPMVGLLVAAVWSASGVLRGMRLAFPAAAAAAVTVAFSAASAAQVGRWRDDLTLFTHAAAVTRGNWAAQFQLGSEFQRLGRLPEAIAHYREALRDRPGFSEALDNLGLALAATGDAAGAEASYRAAIRADPRNAEAYNNLGGLLMAAGRDVEARTSFLQALQVKPEAPEPRLNLGLALLRQGRAAEAEAALAAVVRACPTWRSARAALGDALAAQGRSAEAAVQFREAARLAADASGAARPR
jgi:tetratricopeptide (TPR) repeat protein